MFERTRRKIRLLWLMIPIFRFYLYLCIINVPITIVAVSLGQSWQALVLYMISLSFTLLIIFGRVR
jgi:hypothetical protein